MTDIQKYAQTIGLDETATTMLQNLAPEFQEEVYRTFSSEGSTNVSARLVTFCKRLVQRVTEGGGGGAVGVDTDRAQMEEFCSNWGLDDRSRVCMESASQPVREYVYANFKTDENTKSVNALFMSFMKGAKNFEANTSSRQSEVFAPRHSRDQHVHHRATHGYARASRMEETLCHMASFIRKFKLDSEASALLLELTDDIRETVMDSFQPPLQDEYSRLFTSFAHSRLRMRGSHAQPPLQQHFESGRGHGALTTSHGAHGGAPSANGRKRERSDDVDFFCRKWNLDESCRDVLESMSGKTREDVMAEFSPPPNAENVNRVFVGFARSRGSNSRNMPAPSPQLSAAMDSFIAQHGLDAKAQDVLVNLKPHMAEEIMATFDGARDGNVNKLFMSFTKMKTSSGFSSRR